MTSIKGTHIDRSMYKDLLDTKNAGSLQKQLEAIETVVIKNLKDGPKASRDKLVVGEVNALQKFIDGLPKSETRDELSNFLKFVPKYDVVSIRTGQTSGDTSLRPTDRAFYVGSWKLSQAMSNVSLFDSLTINQDGSWSIAGAGHGMATVGQSFKIEKADWIDASLDARLLVLETNGNSELGLVGADFNGTDILTITGAQGDSITLVRT